MSFNIPLLSPTFLTALTHASTLPKSSPIPITINPSTTYQHIDGFGISEAFGHAALIQSLPANNSTAILDFPFSTPSALGDYPEERHRASGGRTERPWNSGERAATVYADAWSAPSFMKTNNDSNNGGYLCGVSGTNCTYDWRTAYANYLVECIKLYSEQFIDIDYIGWINEPEENVTYSSMLLENGQQAADFIDVLAPILKKSGYKTEQACCDAAGWEYQRYLLEGIQAAGAEQHLGIVTSHGYITPPTTPFNTSMKVYKCTIPPLLIPSSTTSDSLAVHDIAHKRETTGQTEWADLSTQGQQPWYLNGGTAEALTWANHMQSALTISNVSAFLGWVGTTGSFLSNDAFIQVVNTTWQVSPRLWAFAQFSCFVKPGARRISASTAVGSLGVSAFRNSDGSVAVQVINNSDGMETVLVEGVFADKGVKSVMTYLSDNANNLTAIEATADGAKGFKAQVPARTMVSFVVPAK